MSNDQQGPDDKKDENAILSDEITAEEIASDPRMFIGILMQMHDLLQKCVSAVHIITHDRAMRGDPPAHIAAFGSMVGALNASAVIIQMLIDRQLEVSEAAMALGCRECGIATVSGIPCSIHGMERVQHGTKNAPQA
jgi:hypothetical protein